MQTSSPKGENGADQGYKELCTPPSNEGWTAQKNVIHIWPRHSYMLIGFPNTDREFHLLAAHPVRGAVLVRLNTVGARTARPFRESFPASKKLSQ